MIRLGTEELERLSALTGIAPYLLKKLQAMRLLSEKAAVDALITYEFKRTRRRNMYKSSDIIKRLAIKYDVSVSYASSRAYGPQKQTKRYCKVCGREIQSGVRLNDGKCNRCAIDAIKLADDL